VSVIPLCLGPVWKEADRLLRRSVREGVERYAEAFAAADRENDAQLARKREAARGFEREPGELPESARTLSSWWEPVGRD